MATELQKLVEGGGIGKELADTIKEHTKVYVRIYFRTESTSVEPYISGLVEDGTISRDAEILFGQEVSKFGYKGKQSIRNLEHMAAPAASALRNAYVFTTLSSVYVPILATKKEVRSIQLPDV